MSSKIKNCKTCNAQIAANAKTCPYCGAKNKKPFFKKPIFWIFIVIFIGLIALLFGGGDKEIDYSKPDITVTSDEIMNDYSSNTVTADEKYRNKTVEVSGQISTISEYTIRLSGDEDDNWLTNVVISLAPGQDDMIRRLAKDAKLTVVGVCKSTDMFSDIKIENAKIIEEKTELSSGTVQNNNTDDNSPVNTDIDTFMNDYSSNSVAADDKYKGRTVVLTGCKVYSVEDGYVQLEGNDEWSLDFVNAYYNDKESIKELKKDDVVTVTGVCKGEELFGIKVTDCEFEK